MEQFYWLPPKRIVSCYRPTGFLKVLLVHGPWCTVIFITCCCALFACFGFGSLYAFFSFQLACLCPVFVTFIPLFMLVFLVCHIRLIYLAVFFPLSIFKVSLHTRASMCAMPCPLNPPLTTRLVLLTLFCIFSFMCRFDDTDRRNDILSIIRV